MSHELRPELSEKNKYWIERHRYYELKHFCLQYPLWKKALAMLDGFTDRPADLAAFISSSNISDPTAACAEERLRYLKWINMVRSVAEKTSPDLANYILKGVTDGVSYNYLYSKLDIPCCRDTYYDLYRRFFWLLDKERE